MRQEPVVAGPLGLEERVLTLPEKLLFVVLAVASGWYTFVGFRRVARVVARGERAFSIPRWMRMALKLDAK